MIKYLTRSALLGAASTLVIGAAAQAQSSDTSNERRTVDVITVTAQQREESIQDVPISIGAYDSEALAEAGVKDIKDLISIAPGLMVTSTQSETITTARIRGIGTVGDNFGLESSVGVYIDGVFRARNGVGFGDLGELERIEVLRGPQGTLYGKNTSAGVLSVTTKAPEFEYGGSVEYTHGDYGLGRFAGHVTGALVEDKVAVRVFAAHGERDGFTQLVLGKGSNAKVVDAETQNYYTLRGQLLFTPNESVEGRIIADYSSRNESCCSAVAWDYSPAIGALVQALGGNVNYLGDPSDRIAYSNHAYIQQVKDSGVSAEFDFDTSFGTLTTVTSLRNWKNRRGGDADYTSLDIAYLDPDGTYTYLERFSQEIRLTGVSGNLDWLIGGFFSHEDLELGQSLKFGEDWETLLGMLVNGSPTGFSSTMNALALGLLGVPGIPGWTPLAPGSFFEAGSGVNQDVYNQTSDSWALFTHNTYQATDDFAITFGLRYTSETKDILATFDTANTPGCSLFETYGGFNPAAALAGTALAGLVPSACLPYARTGLDANGYDRERQDEEVSGTIRLTYDVSDDAMIFAGYSRGFKAGGFNLDRQFNGPIGANGYTDSDSSFEPEFVDSYEIGIKSQLFDNVLQLNATAFWQQIENLQLNTFNGLAFVVESVDESESNGFEIDAAWATPIPGLDITAGYAYVDAKYTDVNTGDRLVDAIEGKNYSLAPKNYLTTQMIYQTALTDNLMGSFSLDARHVTEYNTGSDLDPEKVQDGFTLVNARFSVGRENGLWSLDVWGRNLTDEAYAQVAFDGFAQGSRTSPGTSNDPRNTASYMAFMGAPRTWGMTLRTEW